MSSYQSINAPYYQQQQEQQLQQYQGQLQQNQGGQLQQMKQQTQYILLTVPLFVMFSFLMGSLGLGSQKINGESYLASDILVLWCYGGLAYSGLFFLVYLVEIFLHANGSPTSSSIHLFQAYAHLFFGSISVFMFFLSMGNFYGSDNLHLSFFLVFLASCSFCAGLIDFYCMHTKKIEALEQQQ